MNETLPVTENRIHISIDIALPNNLVEVNSSLIKQAIERFLQNKSNALTKHSIEEIINSLRDNKESEDIEEKPIEAAKKWKAFLEEADQYAIEDKEITKNFFREMKEFRENFEMKDFPKA